MFPQATYFFRFFADQWTLIANDPLRRVARGAFTNVVDFPLTTLLSGYAGVGSSFRHVPWWM